MKMFENTTKDEEFLFTLGAVMAVLGICIRIFTNAEAEMVIYLFGSDSGVILAFLARFIFNTILILSFVIPWSLLFCFSLNDGIISRRYCDHY